MQPNYSSGKDEARYPWNGRSVCSRLQLQPDTQFHSNKHEIDSRGSNTVRAQVEVHVCGLRCMNEMISVPFLLIFTFTKVHVCESETKRKGERKKELVGIMCFSQESAIRVCALGLMAKTVRGVVRLGGPLSPDTLPSNVFIITAGGKKALKVTLQKKKKKFASFLLYAHVAYWALCGNAKIMHKNSSQAQQRVMHSSQMTAQANSGAKFSS